MKKIEISIKGEKDKFVFTDIQIEDLNERQEFGKDENHNYGILFKYPFGTQYLLSDLNNETNETFNLVIKESSNLQCFELSEESKALNFTIKNEEPLLFNESIKKLLYIVLKILLQKMI